MNIDKTSADIAAEYIFGDIEFILDKLSNNMELLGRGLSNDMANDTIITNFRYAMALCDVLSELDSSRDKKAEELINNALMDYGDDILSQIDMPSWPY